MHTMTLDDVKTVSLEILLDVHDFCVKNSITYSLYGGTAIGAIRHQGFIPWDDDIDVGMPRPDYDRFVKTYKSEKRYEIFSREREDGEDVLISFSRVCDMEKTFVDSSSNPWTKRETGVWIDIFPLDGVESNFDECKTRIDKMKKVYHRENIVRYSNFTWDHAIQEGPFGVIRLLARKVVFPFIKGSVDKHISMCREISWQDSLYFANITYLHYGIRERHNKRVFDKVILAMFEGHEFYIMEGYDEALKEKYGNYMQLPPENERVGGHSVNHFYWK